MERPNEEQVEHALNILRKYGRDYGNAGSEVTQRRAVFSILAALGGPGNVSDEFAGLEFQAVNEPSTSPQQLSDNSDPSAGYTTGPSADSASAYDASGAQRQLPGGEKPAHPEGRTDPGVAIQSWPPQGADLDLFKVDELRARHIDELIDWARVAGVEDVEDQSHEQLVRALHNAAYGDEADDFEDEAPEGGETSESDDDSETTGYKYSRAELEELTVSDLRDMAADEEITGRSNMHKDELVDALANIEGDSDEEE